MRRRPPLRVSRRRLAQWTGPGTVGLVILIVSALIAMTLALWREVGPR